ncbi:MAG: hypothetical protein WDA16_09510 [Candidatus Thermoplasmatota archaeon]
MRLAPAATLLIILLGAPTAMPLPEAPTPVTQPACAGAHAPVLFASWPTQLENLAFDGTGNLYVSDFGGDHLLRLAPDGAVTIVDGLPIHGMTFGPDGKLYVGSSDASGSIQVWRFESLSPPVHTVVASGLPDANGMAFDGDGDLFVSNPLGTSAPYLVRLPAADMRAWAAWGSQYGPNGLWLDPADGTLIAGITGDQSSPIVRLSTTDPTRVETIAQLSLGAATLQPGVHAPAERGGLAPKGLDDLTLGPDGNIYAAAHVTGEVMRVDPATGEACVLASGLHEPTSVRVARGFGSWDGKLFVTEMGGEAVTALYGPGAGAVWVIDIAS